MMKRVIILVVILVLTLSLTVSANESEKTYKDFPVVNININGQLIHSEVPGINVDGNSLVPLRVISESLGAGVSWDASTATVTILQKKEENSTSNFKLDFETDLDKIYILMSQEVGSIQNLIQQLELSKEYYQIDKDTSWLRNLTQFKYKDKQTQYDVINNLILDFLQIYPTQKNAYNALIETQTQYDDVLKKFQSAINAINDYTSSDDEHDLRNYYYFLVQANDALYKLQNTLNTKINELNNEGVK